MYDVQAKVDQLGIPWALIQEYGAVSAPVAEALAVAVRIKFQSDLGVSVVGIAGPGGGEAGKPVGTTFVGVAAADGVKSHHTIWPGTRTEVQSRAAKMALNALRMRLRDGKQKN